MKCTSQLKKFLHVSLPSAAVLIAGVLEMQVAYGEEPSIKPKIFNGTTTTTQAWPWMVALISNNKANAYQGRFCGGTLIAKNWVLTAAHCVFDENNRVESVNAFDVLLNRTILSSTGGERIAVEKIIVHNQYNKESSNNDIALIKLRNQSSATPIETFPNYSDLDEAGSESTALGWGAFVTINQNEIFADVLRKVTLPIVSNAACQRTMPHSITNNMLCAGYQTGGIADTCGGDSGGPLVVFDYTSGTWRQAGITSFGYGKCGALTSTYGVYTRLENYKSWISNNICSAFDKPLTPNLSKFVNGNYVYLSWTRSTSDTKYRITYTAYGKNDFHSFEMRDAPDFGIRLPKGSDYEVWVHAYRGNCVSQDYSNSVRVTVK